MPDGPQRVVVAAPNWLGDAVMALPALRALRAWCARRAPRRGGAAGRGAALRDGARASTRSSRLNPRAPVTRPAAWRQDAATLAAGRFDLALLLPNSFVSAWTASRAAIPERWGYATDGRGPLLTRRVRRPRGLLHQADYYLALTGALGLPAVARAGVAYRCRRRPARRAVGAARRRRGAQGSWCWRPARPTAAPSSGRRTASPRWRSRCGAIADWRRCSSAPARDAAASAELRDALRSRAGGRPALAAMVDLVGRTDLADAGRRARAGPRRRRQRLGRDAPGRRGRRAGRGDLRRHQRAPHGAAGGAPRRPAAAPGHPRRVVPAVSAAGVPDRAPVHARRIGRAGGRRSSHDEQGSQPHDVGRTAAGHLPRSRRHDDRGRRLPLRAVTAHALSLGHRRRAPVQPRRLRRGRRDQPGRHRPRHDPPGVRRRAARRDRRAAGARRRARRRLVPLPAPSRRRSSTRCASTAGAASPSPGWCSTPSPTSTSIRRGRGSSATSGSTCSSASRSALAASSCAPAGAASRRTRGPTGQTVHAICDTLAGAAAVVLAADASPAGA